MYVDNLSRPSKSSPIAGRGVTMKATRNNNSKTSRWCSYCKKSTDHVIQDCARLKAKRQHDQSNRYVPPYRAHGAPPPREGRQTGNHPNREPRSTNGADSTGVRRTVRRSVVFRLSSRKTRALTLFLTFFSAFLSACDPPRHCGSQPRYVLFTVAKAPAADREGASSALEQPEAFHYCSGFLEAFGGMTGEETDSLVLTVGEEPVKERVSCSMSPSGW